MKQETGVAVRWTAFPLHPETPEDGRSLDDLFKGMEMDIQAVLNHLKKVADEENLPFGPRDMTYNSRRAQELGKWAETQAAGDAFHDAAFRAYFDQGLNLAKISVLRDLAASVGLDPDGAEETLTGGHYKAAVDADWSRSRAMGVRAVPTFFFGGRAAVGAQPYATLKKLVETGTGGLSGLL